MVREQKKGGRPEHRPRSRKQNPTHRLLQAAQVGVRLEGPAPGARGRGGGDGGGGVGVGSGPVVFEEVEG